MQRLQMRVRREVFDALLVAAFLLFAGGVGLTLTMLEAHPAAPRANACQ